MKGINVLIILITLMSIGVLAMTGPAMSVTTSNISASNSALVFENGKPVSQVVGPIGSSTNQSYDSSTYQYLDSAFNKQMISHALINWTISSPYVNMTFAEFVNGAFVKYEFVSINTTAEE